MKSFDRLKVGDDVTRMIGGVIPMKLKVTAVTDKTVACGDWTFDKQTGFEIDDELEWGPQYGASGSQLVHS